MKSTNNKGKKKPFMKRVGIPLIVLIVGVLMIFSMPWDTLMQGSSVFNRDNQPAQTDDPNKELDVLPTLMPDPDEPDYDTGIYNPLTGRPVFEDISKNRPWAAAIGNTPEAQPLWGIGKADIMLEYLVEGSTRFMAIYQDISRVDTIRGLRSFRTSSMELAAGFDAIHTHWGGRTYENQEVYGNPATRWGTIDAEWGPIGFRISTSVLNKALEHRAATTGERLLSNVPDTFRTEHEAIYRHPFTFKKDGTPAGGKSAENVTVTYPFNVKTTKFTYNQNEGVYYVEQYRNKLIDGLDDKELSFTNVLILQMSISSIKVNESTNHMRITSVGEGTGYFVCGGKYTEIKWSRNDVTSQFKFTLPDGTALDLGVGKTYICIVGLNDTQVFE